MLRADSEFYLIDGMLPKFSFPDSAVLAVEGLVTEPLLEWLASAGYEVGDFEVLYR